MTLHYTNHSLKCSRLHLKSLLPVPPFHFFDVTDLTKCTVPVPPFHFFDVTDRTLPVPPFHFFDVTDRTLPVPPFHFFDVTDEVVGVYEVYGVRGRRNEMVGLESTTSSVTSKK
jgi:hypothetical protein